MSKHRVPRRGYVFNNNLQSHDWTNTGAEATLLRVAAEETVDMATANLLYGPVIDDALANPKSKLEILKTLHEHATAVVAAQGNLKTALGKLDKEIRRREKQVSRKK